MPGDIKDKNCQVIPAAELRNTWPLTWWRVPLPCLIMASWHYLGLATRVVAFRVQTWIIYPWVEKTGIEVDKPKGLFRRPSVSNLMRSICSVCFFCDKFYMSVMFWRNIIANAEMCRYFIYCGVTLIGSSISIRNNTMVAYLCPFLLWASATMVLTPQDKLGLVLHWGEFRFSATHQCYTIIRKANIYLIFRKRNFEIYFRRPRMFSFFG